MPELRFRSDITVELVKHAAGDADVIWAARVSTRGSSPWADVGPRPRQVGRA